MYRGGSADVSSKKAIPIWIHSAPEHRWSQSRGGGGRGQWLLLSWQWWGGSPGHHSTPLTTTDRWWMTMMATSLCSHHRFRHTWRNIPDVVNPLRYPLSWTPIASLIGFLNGPAGTPLSGTWPAAPVATPTLLGYYDCAPHSPPESRGCHSPAFLVVGVVCVTSSSFIQAKPMWGYIWKIQFSWLINRFFCRFFFKLIFL